MLTGCLVEYENVSKESQYSDIVGAKFKTLTTLKIHGVTLGKVRTEVIDQYVVTEAPGFAGREVIEKIDLEIGSIILVKAVMKCTNCIPPDISFVIDIIADELDPDVPVWLYDLSVKDDRGRTVMSSEKLLLIE